MGQDPGSEPPFCFTRPADARVQSGTSIANPPATDDVHHEPERVAAIGSGGANIAEANALAHVFGCAAGTDLTRRDLQAAAKAARRRRDRAKGFAAAAMVGTLHREAPREAAAIRGLLDGVIRQQALRSGLIWPLPARTAQLSALVARAAGALIFTETPAGVGRLLRGQTCRVALTGLSAAVVTIFPA